MKTSIENFHYIDIWANNLEEEFEKISELLEFYPIVSIDTEYPGTVVFPDVNEFKDDGEYNYQLMRLNVNYLKIIQIGITLSNEKGETPEKVNSWQFNFKFNEEEDIQNIDSIKLLGKFHLKFEEHLKSGINPFDFAQLCYTSGLIMNDKITYLSFHSIYDFGYLLKILTSQPLPETILEFYQKLLIFFPHIYDLKLIVHCTSNVILDDLNWTASLQNLASLLDIKRKGNIHNASSDSLITFETFMEYYHKTGSKKSFKIEWKKFENQLFSIVN